MKPVVLIPFAIVYSAVYSAILLAGLGAVTAILWDFFIRTPSLNIVDGIGVAIFLFLQNKIANLVLG